MPSPAGKCAALSTSVERCIAYPDTPPVVEWQDMPLRITAIFVLAAALALPAELTYQKPPREILDVLNAPPPPAISVNPSRDYAILMQPLRYPPIAEVAQPMLRLAGLRIDIRTNGPHLPFSSTAYTIKRQVRTVGTDVDA